MANSLPYITAYRELTSCSLEREIQEEFSNFTQVRKQILDAKILGKDRERNTEDLWIVAFSNH